MDSEKQKKKRSSLYSQHGKSRSKKKEKQCIIFHGKSIMAETKGEERKREKNWPFCYKMKKILMVHFTDGRKSLIYKRGHFQFPREKKKNKKRLFVIPSHLNYAEKAAFSR